MQKKTVGFFIASLDRLGGEVGAIWGYTEVAPSSVIPMSGRPYLQYFNLAVCQNSRKSELHTYLSSFQAINAD